MKNSLRHGVCMQQIYRSWKNDAHPPPLDTSNLQTMEDSNTELL